MKVLVTGGAGYIGSHKMTRRTTARTPEKLPEPPQEKVIYSSKYT